VSDDDGDASSRRSVAIDRDDWGLTYISDARVTSTNRVDGVLGLSKYPDEGSSLTSPAGNVVSRNAGTGLRFKGVSERRGDGGGRGVAERDTSREVVGGVRQCLAS
jgi:hypothetical protein